MTEDVTENTNNKEYEEAKTKLGLVVDEKKDDLNFITIRGRRDNLKMIFKGIYDGLNSSKHQDSEVESGWSYISGHNHLRPGGTYMVTITKEVEEDFQEMLVMNVNARDYAPIVEEMHSVVRQSIVTAAKELKSV